MSEGPTPLYCLTTDFDWASEACLEDFAQVCAQRGIKPTVFATHRSEVHRRLDAAGEVETGIHPNFRSGSTHGDDWDAVMDHMFELFPNAKCSRSHSFFEATPISMALVERGILYDSNLCLYMQAGLFPLEHVSGSLRFPVFWEDDIHWLRASGPDRWDLAAHLPRFLTPGLKVINVHPFSLALNTPGEEHYQHTKSKLKTLSHEEMQELRFQGAGTRTFLLGLLDALLERGVRFHPLGELYGRFRPDQSTTA